MKVRVEFTLDVDRDAWAETYGVGAMSAAEVRADVRAAVEMDTTMRLQDEGVLE